MEFSKHNWATISETMCPEMLIFGKWASWTLFFQNILTNPIISEISFLWRHTLVLYYRVWQIFMRYFCNCGLEFWYCGISKHAEFSVIGSAIFSMDVSNCSIFLCAFTVFGKPSAALQSFFFAHAYTTATRPALIVWYSAQLRFKKGLHFKCQTIFPW